MLKVDYSARQAKLREIAGLDAVALVPGSNMYYFTGLEFHLSERPIIALLTADGELSFIIPELEVPKLNQRPDLEARAFAWSDKDGYADAFQQERTPSQHKRREKAGAWTRHRPHPTPTEVRPGPCQRPSSGLDRMAHGGAARG